MHAVYILFLLKICRSYTVWDAHVMRDDANDRYTIYLIHLPNWRLNLFSTKSGQCDRAVKAVKEGRHVVTIIGPVTPATIFVLTSKGSILEKPNPYRLGRWGRWLIPKAYFHFWRLLKHFPTLTLNRAPGKVVIYPIP